MIYVASKSSELTVAVYGKQWSSVKKGCHALYRADGQSPGVVPHMSFRLVQGDSHMMDDNSIHSVSLMRK